MKRKVEQDKTKNLYGWKIEGKEQKLPIENNREG